MDAISDALHVTLFTDGSALSNPGPGGWAALLRRNGRETLLAGGCPERTTNNRMELTALLHGLQALDHPCQVTVVTDSEYVRGVLSLGWKRKANHELLRELDGLLLLHEVSFEVVRGHSGHPENERVDAAARAEAERAKCTGLASSSSSDHGGLPQGPDDTAAHLPLLREVRLTASNTTLRALVDDLDAGRVCLQDFDQDLLATLQHFLSPLVSGA